ncbi:family 20 glycosylhydrolase [Dysgonomonas termitidis]|uniref:beta-N-acetylhexosaminidase n=1 Tax=Dysgonomonas termitidis TaxID=1516126 RepID=A0ABV9L2K0_9BACT
MNTLHKISSLVLIGISLFLISCNGNKIENVESIQIIPIPREIIIGTGTFALNTNTSVYTNMIGDEKNRILEYLRLSSLLLNKEAQKEKTGTLQLLLVESTNKENSESYHLQINSSGIKIEATDGAGIFYGIQTLLQLVEQYGMEKIPAISINDYPYLKYRGLLIDVSRHFFSKEFIKKQIDMMAYYKMNRLHWHLVDGAGWRIEIKKYPELTDKTAWRLHENLVEWSDNGKQYCSKGTQGHMVVIIHRKI